MIIQSIWVKHFIQKVSVVIASNRKKRPFKRNLILLVTFFLLFLVPVIGIRFVNTEPVLIAPKLYKERNVIRGDEEKNGYNEFVKALDLLPNKPQFLLTMEDGYEVSYMPPTKSVGNRLKVLRPDNDPLLLKYVEDCQPAFDLIPIALQKEYVLFPKPRVVEWRFNTGYEYEELLPLIIALSGAAQSEILTSGRIDSGVDLLQKAYLLHNKLIPDVEIYVSQYAGELLATTKNIALAMENKRELRQLLQMLLDTPPLYSTPEQVLNRWYNVFDNTIMFPHSGNMPEGSMDISMRISLWQYQQAAKFLSKDENNMAILIDKPSADYIEWVNARNLKGFNFINNVERFAISTILSELLSAHINYSSFMANKILLAAKLYKIENNTFPESLEDLVPTYFPEVPENKGSDTPFKYVNKGDYFELYSDGYSFVNFWGEIRKPKHHIFFEAEDFEFPHEED